MDTVKKVLDNRKNQVEQGEEQFLYTLTGMYSFSLFFDDTSTFLSLAICLLSSVGTGLASSFLPSFLPFPPSFPYSCLFCSSFSVFLSFKSHSIRFGFFSVHSPGWGGIRSSRGSTKGKKRKLAIWSSFYIFEGLRCLVDCSISPVI